jgi:hypothetical protein
LIFDLPVPRSRSAPLVSSRSLLTCVCGSLADADGICVLWQSSDENLPPQVLRYVLKELGELSVRPPDGIKVIVKEGDVSDIQAVIAGPGR